MRISLGIFLVLLLSSCGQTPPPPQALESHLQNIWMGGAVLIDPGVYTSYPAIFSFTEDNQFISKKIGESIDTVAYTLEADGLKLDNYTVARKDLVVKGDILYLNDGFKRQMHRIQAFAKCPNNIAEIKSLLSQKYWSNKEEVLQFQADGSYKEYKLAEDGKYKACYYEIDSFENMYFLSKRAVENLKNGRNYYVEQIVSLDDKELKVFRWEKNTFQTISYQAIDRPTTIQETPVDFQLCHPYLYVHNRSNRYYYQGTRYNGGHYAIKKRIAAEYKAPNVDENGLVRIRFVVNCEGKTGQFEVLELDENYKERSFDSRITTQLLKITESLDDWIAGAKNDYAVDTYFFISYKIKEGKVVDLFP